MNREIKVNPLIIFYNRLKAFNPFNNTIPVITKYNNYKPFLIIGSGRSGTTLLRSMLNQSSSVEIPPESFVLPLLVKRHTVWKNLDWKDYIKLIIGEFHCHPQFKYWNFNTTHAFEELMTLPPKERSLFKVIDVLYTQYAKTHGKPTALWGDKTPLNTYHLPQLDSILNEPRYINMIRDGRDVVASYRKAKLSESIEDACTRWKDAVLCASVFEEKNEQSVLNVRYESLVRDPKAELLKVCDFLHINFDECMLQNNRNTENLGDSVYAHHEKLKKPIDQSSIGNWEKQLSIDEQQLVNKLIGAELKQLGYLK
ncbi:MAG: sulfotransferase [Fulvivirga sp.]|uniref:sulfotransferase family protein n=1 Tax=Fulvivirga sp. TaxID=1931237 RepID=UPI0032EBD70C